MKIIKFFLFLILLLALRFQVSAGELYEEAFAKLIQASKEKKYIQIQYRENLKLQKLQKGKYLDQLLCLNLLSRKQIEPFNKKNVNTIINSCYSKKQLKKWKGKSLSAESFKALPSHAIHAKDFPYSFISLIHFIGEVGDPNHAQHLVSQFQLEEHSSIVKAFLHAVNATLLLKKEKSNDLSQAYENIKGMLSFQKRNSYEFEQNDIWTSFIKDWILKSIDKGHQKLNGLKYDPGYIAYQAARAQDISLNDLGAYLNYKSIVSKYPNSYYAEASRSYLIENLLELSKKFKKGSLNKKVKELSYQVKKLKKSKDQKLYFDKRTQLKSLEQLNNIRDLESLALNELRLFTSDNQTGYYRLEAIITFAEFQLFYKHSLRQTIHWLKKAEELMVSIESGKAFVTPEPLLAKVLEDSRPHNREYKFDQFGNIIPLKINPREILHRDSCSWYMDRLKTKMYQMRGLIAMCTDSKEAALNHFNLSKKYDRLSKAYRSHDDWGNVDRLINSAELGYFKANQEQLKIYSQNIRLALMLGDYYYITMDFDKAKDLYGKVLDGKMGTLNKRQKVYPNFIYGSCHYWLDEGVKALEYYKKAYTSYSKGYSSEIAKFAYANLATDFIEENLASDKASEYYKEGKKILLELSKNSRSKEMRYKAILSLSVVYQNEGKYHQSFEVLNLIPKKDKTYYKKAKAYQETISRFVSQLD